MSAKFKDDYNIIHHSHYYKTDVVFISQTIKCMWRENFNNARYAIFNSFSIATMAHVCYSCTQCVRILLSGKYTLHVKFKVVRSSLMASANRSRL